MRHLLISIGFLLTSMAFAGQALSDQNTGTAGQFDPKEQDGVLIVGAHLEGRLDEDPTSGYTALADMLFASEQSVHFQHMPLTRALRSFQDKNSSCFFPGSTKAIHSLTKEPPENFLESVPIDLVSSHVFSPEGEPVFMSFGDLEGKTLAVQNGVSGRTYIETEAKYEIQKIPDDLSGLRMLIAGRVDALYGWYPDTFIIAEKNRLALPVFNPDLVIFETTTHVVCRRFDGVEGLLDRVSNRLDSLRESGGLQDMLGEYARIVRK